MNEIRHRKHIEEERERVTRANEELFDEAQRLSDREALWDDQKAALEAGLVSGLCYLITQRASFLSKLLVVNCGHIPVPFFQANVTRELGKLKSELCNVEAMEMEASERTRKMVSRSIVQNRKDRFIRLFKGCLGSPYCGYYEAQVGLERPMTLMG